MSPKTRALRPRASAVLAVMVALGAAFTGGAGRAVRAQDQPEPPPIGYDPLASALAEASDARQAGRPEVALAAVERALAVAPRDPAAHLAHARLLSELGRHQQAVEVLDAQIESRGPTARALTVRGRALVQLGRRSDGERDLREALALYPANGPARAELIEVLRTGNRVKEATAQLLRLRLQAPELAWVMAQEARLRAAAGHGEAVLAELEAALVRDDELGSIRRAAIEIALAAGRPARAFDAAQAWLDDPSAAPDSEALVLSARAARAAGRDLIGLRAALAALGRDTQSPAAIAATVELLGLAPELIDGLLMSRLGGDGDVVARAWLARRALDAGRLGEALELLQPDGEPLASDELRLLEAEALRRAGREAEAIARLDALCQPDGPARPFYERALARFALGQFEPAVADFERAARGELTAIAQFNRGTVLDRLGRYTQAAAAYEQAVEADSQMAQAWMQLGNSYHFRLGDRARAAGAYRRFLAIAGEDAQVRAWLEEVE